ncbi:chromosome partitioning protein ParB, partial [Lactobacillus jensenii]
MARDSRNNELRKKGGLGRGIEALFEDTPTQ